MPREVAYTYLTAAAEAFPFTAEAAHRLCTLELSRTPQLLFSPRTQHLASELETWMRTRAGGLSLDALQQLCDHAWFADAPSTRPLAHVLRDLARRTLEPSGGRVILRRQGDVPQRLAHYRWLSLLLPPDLLIAALGPGPTADRVTLVSAHLGQVLNEHPVAETHLHLGAALSFGQLWTGLTRQLAEAAPRANELAKSLPRVPDPIPFGDGRRFVGMLLAAAIGRTLLAAFLVRRERRGAPKDLNAFFHDDLPGLCERMRWTAGPVDAAHRLRGALRLLVRGQGELALPRLGALYRKLVGASPRPEEGQCPLAAVIAADPLARWLPHAPGRALPETRFAARALRYLLDVGASDKVFAEVFWQYQRVRSGLYRYLVMEPGTAGLDWFQRFYNRISPLRKALRPAAFESALALEGSDLNLGALEVRWAPDRGAAEVRESLRDIARAAQHEAARAQEGLPQPPEVGVVLHFLKERVLKVGKPGRLHADPRQVAHGARFGAFAYARLVEAIAIATALERNPELLLVLRGLDVASTELAVPTWAMLPALARARRASEAAAAKLAAREPRWRVTRLRLRCHAGEDYRRLVEGLRRVHELIEFGGLGEGDRIGHGVCLGHDPARWAGAGGALHQPAEDRLDDLLWELDGYGREHFGTQAGRYAYARAEALALGKRIYGEVDLDDLIAARRRRHDQRLLERLGFPFMRGPRPRDRVEWLVYRYLTDAGVFVRGQEPRLVKVSEGEVALLVEAQRWLRRELARREITVESNPSSNVLIGDMLSVEEHPSFQLQPLPKGGVAPEGALLLSLNSDDPLTFATSLADEYAYLYGALLRQKVPASEALAWLGQRRDHGFRSRFTLGASRSPRALGQLTPPRGHRARRAR